MKTIRNWVQYSPSITYSLTVFINVPNGKKCNKTSNRGSRHIPIYMPKNTFKCGNNNIGSAILAVTQHIFVAPLLGPSFTGLTDLA